MTPLALLAAYQGTIGSIWSPTGPIRLPRYVDLPVGLIANPDFESADNGWDGSRSTYYDAGTGNVVPGGNGAWSVGSAHSGQGYYDFNLSSSYGPNSQYSSVYQPLLKPTLGSQVSIAQVWARSEYQTLYVTIEYGDGTTSTAGYDVFSDDGEYQRVDFKGLIKPTKTVTGIEIGVTGTYDAYDLSIDDVSLVRIVRTYL